MRIADQVADVVQPGLHRHELANRDSLLAIGGELGPVRPDRCVVVQLTSISEHVQHGRRHALGRRPGHGHGVAFPRQPTGRVAIPGPHVEHRTAVEIHAQCATTGRQRRPASECRDFFETLSDQLSRHIVNDFHKNKIDATLSTTRRPHRTTPADTTSRAHHRRSVLGDATHTPAADGPHPTEVILTVRECQSAGDRTSVLDRRLPPRCLHAVVVRRISVRGAWFGRDVRWVRRRRPSPDAGQHIRRCPAARRNGGSVAPSPPADVDGLGPSQVCVLNQDGWAVSATRPVRPPRMVGREGAGSGCHVPEARTAPSRAAVTGTG